MDMNILIGKKYNMYIITIETKYLKEISKLYTNFLKTRRLYYE